MHPKNTHNKKNGKEANLATGFGVPSACEWEKKNKVPVKKLFRTPQEESWAQVEKGQKSTTIDWFIGHSSRNYAKKNVERLSPGCDPAVPETAVS